MRLRIPCSQHCGIFQPQRKPGDPRRLFYGMWKVQAFPKLTQLMRGRARTGTQVSWLSIQNSFQCHFSNDCIGSLTKWFASHFLWLETWASQYPSFRGMKVTCWGQNPDPAGIRNWVRGMSLIWRNRLQQDMRAKQWGTKGAGRGRDLPGAPALAPGEAWHICMFP